MLYRRSPIHDGRAFFRRQPPVIGEFPEIGMREPRRHPLFFHDFGNGRRLGRYFVIIGQRKRRRCACVMANDTMLVDQRRNVLGVGERGMLRLGRGKGDRATVGHGFRLPGGLAGHEVVQGFLQILPAGRGLDAVSSDIDHRCGPCKRWRAPSSTTT